MTNLAVAGRRKRVCPSGFSVERSAIQSGRLAGGATHVQYVLPLLHQYMLVDSVQRVLGGCGRLLARLRRS